MPKESGGGGAEFSREKVAELAREVNALPRQAQALLSLALEWNTPPLRHAMLDRLLRRQERIVREQREYLDRLRTLYRLLTGEEWGQ